MLLNSDSSSLISLSSSAERRVGDFSDINRLSRSRSRSKSSFIFPTYFSLFDPLCPLLGTHSSLYYSMIFEAFTANLLSARLLVCFFEPKEERTLLLD